MKFNVLCDYANEVIVKTTKNLTNLDILILDVRCADIIVADTKRKVSDVLVIPCEAGWLKYQWLKRLGDYDEVLYEGLKTLY